MSGNLVIILVIAAVVIGVLLYQKQAKANLDYMPPLPTALRADLWFTYYLCFEPAAVADHCNVIFEPNRSGAAATIASMRLHGKPVILDIHSLVYSAGDKATPLLGYAAAIDTLFAAMRAAGVLAQVQSIYPIDEPETRGLDDATVTLVNQTLRAVADKYSELAGVDLKGVKLDVIYGMSGPMPGFASYDRIGRDGYDERGGVLISPQWLDLMHRLEPHQRAILVPGGADPWKQDPEPFRRYAHSTPQVALIVAFERDVPEYNHPGIRDNGMTDKYRAVGLEIIGAGNA